MAVRNPDRYDPSIIEPKWQRVWEERAQFRAVDGDARPKSYLLFEFPYPSGDGLHVGHCRPYSAMDALARKHRLEGKNVLFPIGWDAFGLPTENYALKTGVHPRVATEKNVANFTRQMRSLGLSLDWSREVNTTDPAYYRWTQWIFLRLFNKGLAYQAEIPINWCPKDKIGLANEEVIAGKCERCGTPVTRKRQKQWLLKITAYADRLLKDLDTVDYPDRVKVQQENWIGKSEGALVGFRVEATRDRVDVFTTRPDTLFGATYLVLAPEHPLVEKITAPKQSKTVQQYVAQAAKKSDLDRTDLAKEKTGVFTGAYAMNPVNNERIPIWVADYVLSTYGTGAIMAVPAHDNRDYEFATKFHLPIRTVIHPGGARCIIVHGCPSSSNNDPKTRTYDKHWIPRLKQQLESRGIKTETPLMPTPWFADYETWKQAFDQLTIDEETILVGHSCGCAFLTRWLGETKRVVRALVLVAPWKIPDPEKKHFEEKKRFYEFNIDATIPERVSTIVMFTADNEEEDGKKSLEMYHRVLRGNTISLSGHGHYTTTDMGTTEFPELLDTVSKLARVQPDTRDLLSKNPIEVGASPAAFGHLAPETPPVVWTGEGVLVQSGAYSRLTSDSARKKIVAALERRGLGKPAVQYKLRDWVFSRQHYWGEPIPIIHCLEHGAVPVPEDQLPVELPHVDKYQPTDTGESPLAEITEWVNTTCPVCQKPAKRETDTMPNWAGSSWYYLRYTDPKNNHVFADPKKLDYWLRPNGVDLYEGGMEHTTLHLLYSRFWHKFFFDEGLVPTSEPYAKRRSHGIVLAEDGRKMSKSFGNVINPDEVIEKHGADTLRLYEMFMGPFEDAIPWSTRGLIGMRRFLERVWRVSMIIESSKNILKSVPGKSRRIHPTIKKVGDDLEQLKFNTALSALMEYFNARDFAGKVITSGELEENEIDRAAFQQFLTLLLPLAPHIASELLDRFGVDPLAVRWPVFDPALAVEGAVTMAVQVNGTLRATFELPLVLASDKEDTMKVALQQPNVQRYLRGENPEVYFVPRRLINFVVDEKKA